MPPVPVRPDEMLPVSDRTDTRTRCLPVQSPKGRHDRIGRSPGAMAHPELVGDDFDERPHLLARDGHRVALTGVFDALGHDFVLVLPLDVGAAVASDDVEHSASS